MASQDSPSADAYDAWFRAKVQEALDDPRPGIPHEVVMRETRALIDEIAARQQRSKD